MPARPALAGVVVDGVDVTVVVDVVCCDGEGDGASLELVDGGTASGVGEGDPDPPPLDTTTVANTAARANIPIVAASSAT